MPDGGFPLAFRVALRAFGALRVLGLRAGEPLLPRLVFMGADAGESVETLRRIRSVSGWVNEWSALAGCYEDLGALAGESGDPVGVVECLTRAVAYLRIAEYFETEPSARRRLWTRLVETSTRLGSHARPQIRRCEINVRGLIVPALLSLPDVSGPAPCVLTLGGVDGVKEEFFDLLAAYAARGWAGIAIDLPGQGELRRFGDVAWRADAETVISGVIDHLVGLPAIDPNRIALVGGSGGGYFALRAAATDHRIVGCAVISAPVRLLEVYRCAPEPIPRTIAYNMGLHSPDAVESRLREFDAGPLLPNITCPVLQVHGGKDSTVPIAQAEELRAALGARLTSVTYVDGDHMCFNHRPTWEAIMRIWLAERFGAGTEARAVGRPRTGSLSSLDPTSPWHSRTSGWVR